MEWEVGQLVIKQPCPMKCVCDGAEIPPGTVGTVDAQPMTRPRMDGRVGQEAYIKVSWETGRTQRRSWWVFEHGLAETVTIPDMFYLD